MNWGHGVAIAFTLFATFIMYMVVSAFHENMDLVSDDYYARELAYEQKMKQKVNFERLGVKIELIESQDGIIIKYPKAVVQPKGKVYFYHLSREIFDKEFTIALNDKRKQLIPRDQLVAGRYRVNITWQSEGKEYFQKESLFVK